MLYSYYLAKDQNKRSRWVGLPHASHDSLTARACMWTRQAHRSNKLPDLLCRIYGFYLFLLFENILSQPPYWRHCSPSSQSSNWQASKLKSTPFPNFCFGHISTWTRLDPDAQQCCGTLRSIQSVFLKWPIFHIHVSQWETCREKKWAYTQEREV